MTLSIGTCSFAHHCYLRTQNHKRATDQNLPWKHWSDFWNREGIRSTLYLPCCKSTALKFQVPTMSKTQVRRENYFVVILSL